MKNRDNPRFILKHALRMRNLFLEENNDINNDKGDKVATLGKVKWASDTILEYTIKMAYQTKFITTNIDIGEL